MRPVLKWQVQLDLWDKSKVIFPTLHTNTAKKNSKYEETLGFIKQQ